MITAFDSDVLIYAVEDGHPLGQRIRTLFSADPDVYDGVGSCLLLAEVLAKPMRNGQTKELLGLTALLSRIELHSVTAVIGELAASLAAEHRLRAADAAHLGTAIAAGADRFVTNNRRDFPTTIAGIEIVYPEMLPAP